MTAPHPADQIVRRYLDAVARAIIDLPDDRRAELLDDLSRHIAAERAELDEPTEAGVRAIIERLGDPAAIAAEARVPDGPAVSGSRPDVARPAVALPGVARPFVARPAVAAMPPAVAPRVARPRDWVLLGVGAVLVSLVLVIMAGATVLFYARDRSGPRPDPPIPNHAPSPTPSR